MIRRAQNFVKRRLARYVMHDWIMPTVGTRELNAKMIRLLDVAEAGWDGETPFVRLRNGPIFFGTSSSEVEREIFANHCADYPAALTAGHMRVALDICQRYVRENSYYYNMPRSHFMSIGGGYLDVGAYIGYGTMKAAKTIGPGGRIVAVEPIPENFALLERNLAENGIGNVTAFHAAAGAEDGESTIFAGGRQNNTLKGDLKTGFDSERQRRTVRVMRLDTAIAEADYPLDLPTFTSFEVNGGEPDVVRGAPRLFQESRQLAARIAAPFEIDGRPVRELVLEALAAYEGLRVTAFPRQVYVYR